MAALDKPDVPAGPVKVLFGELHQLHHHAGWPSLRDIARQVGCSRTTVSRAFSNPTVPRWGVLELIVESLGGDIEWFRQLWLAATRSEDIRTEAGPPVNDLYAQAGPELHAAHDAVLRGPLDRSTVVTPASAAGGGSRPVPAQLPVTVGGFVGRDSELRRLDDLLTSSGQQPPTVLIFAVSGTAGVGKTALAVHWAHRVADQFPDGQLYVDLRGYDPTGQILEPAAAVRGFLDVLGVPAEEIPAELDDHAALYRGLLADRRVLVLVDNARDADHVRPLLPGVGPAVIVVTSRSLLTGLVAAHGAHPLVLDLLTETESRGLLERRLGPGRVAAEADAVGQIIGGCARLPLALALVAARAATHPRFHLAAVAGELADAADQACLSNDADDVIGGVRAAFSWSYSTLIPSAAQVFRLLSLHPGPDTTAPAAASLVGLPLAEVRPLLAELLRAGLLEERVPGRYSFHDLLAAYATHLTHAQDGQEQRDAATVRLLDHYTHTAHTIDRHLHPTRDAIPIPLTPPIPGTIPEQPANQQAALGWLDAEWPVLLAAQRLAAAAGRDTHAWQLAWVLDTVLYRPGRWNEWADAWQAALPAAGRLPYPAAATAHRLLGMAVARLGDDEQAHTHLRHALHLHTVADDSVGQSRTHLALARLWERQGRPDHALKHAQQAAVLCQPAAHRRGQTVALNTAS